jgi:hypothetical protein
MRCTTLSHSPKGWIIIHCTLVIENATFILYKMYKRKGSGRQSSSTRALVQEHVWIEHSWNNRNQCGWRVARERKRTKRCSLWTQWGGPTLCIPRTVFIFLCLFCCFFSFLFFYWSLCWLGKDRYSDFSHFYFLIKLSYLFRSILIIFTFSNICFI